MFTPSRFCAAHFKCAEEYYDCPACLKQERNELREAISPGRIGTHGYYLGVAARLRALDGTIRTQALEIINELVFKRGGNA